MGLKEVVRVELSPTAQTTRWNLEGRNRGSVLTEKALSWMEHLFVVLLKPPGVTPPRPDAGNPAGQVVLAQPRGCEVIEPYNWSGSSSPKAVT